MKLFTPVFAAAVLAFPAAALAQTNGYAGPNHVQTVGEAAVKTRPGKETTPTVYISAYGICGKSKLVRGEPKADGNTLVITFTVHTPACKQGQRYHRDGFAPVIDIPKEAKALSMATEKPELKVITKLVND